MACKYLDPASFEAVVVTNNAVPFKATLQKDEPSSKKYESQVAPSVLEADKTIQTLPVKPTKIDIVAVDQVFQK